MTKKVLEGLYIVTIPLYVLQGQADNVNKLVTTESYHWDIVSEVWQVPVD